MGGSGSSGGGWSPSSPTTPCETLKFLAIVNSPQAAALSKLKVGMLLDVILQGGAQPVVAVIHKGTAVGALTGAKVSTLVRCIQNGYRFRAKVMSLDGGHCEVEVQPA